MSAPPPVAASSSLVNRVKGILMQPKSEWEVIDGEPATVGSIYMGYVVPLAAIPAICRAIGLARYSPGMALRLAITTYVLSLLSPFVLAFIIDALAPNFGGQKNQIKALKVAVYAATPTWVAGALSILSLAGFGMLGLVSLVQLVAALYGLYLLFLGLPALMKSPADKAIGYTVVTIVAAVVVYLVVGVVATMAMGGAMGMGGYGGLYR